MTDDFVTVDVRDVEVGDRLAGTPGWPEIASILLDCSDGLWWIFADADGLVIARKRVDSRVQIVRDGDDCPALGLARPLRAVTP